MATTLGCILERSLRYFWPTLWSAVAVGGVLALFGFLPAGIRITMCIGAVIGIYVASDTWEEAACNCDDEDHDH